MLADCGGELSALVGTIESPNYPIRYPSYASCAWKISAPTAIDGQIVVSMVPKTATTSHDVSAPFQLVFMNRQIENSENCSKDSLEILNGRYHNSPRIGNKICGSASVPDIPMRSQGPAMFVRFKSDGSGEAVGFKAMFRVVPKGLWLLEVKV